MHLLQRLFMFFFVGFLIASCGKGKEDKEIPQPAPPPPDTFVSIELINKNTQKGYPGIAVSIVRQKILNEPTTIASAVSDSQGKIKFSFKSEEGYSYYANLGIPAMSFDPMPDALGKSVEPKKENNITFYLTPSVPFRLRIKNINPVNDIDHFTLTEGQEHFPDQNFYFSPFIGKNVDAIVLGKIIPLKETILAWKVTKNFIAKDSSTIFIPPVKDTVDFLIEY